MGKVQTKSPAYQWYPRDILASQRVAEMTAEEECWYRRALDFCWLHGTLPTDPERCARIVGKGCTVEGATVVLKMFQVSTKDATRMVHDRQESERKKQKQYHKRQSNAGKASAAKRERTKDLDGQPNLNHGSTTVEIGLQPKSKSSSSSSSSSSKEKKSPNGDGLSTRNIDRMRTQPEWQEVDIDHVWRKLSYWCDETNHVPTLTRLHGWRRKELLETTTLPDYLDRASLSTWANHRAKLKRPLDNREEIQAQLVAIENLHKAGYDLKLAIQHSVAGGYQAICPAPTDKAGRNNGTKQSNGPNGTAQAGSQQNYGRPSRVDVIRNRTYAAFRDSTSVAAADEFGDQSAPPRPVGR